MNEKNIKKRNVLIAIVIIICITIIISTSLFLIKHNKNKEDIIVSELDYVKALDTDDEVEAAKMIKNNIVRIINTIDNETKVIGTGFFIKEGYLVTNSHIVDIYGDITIEYNDRSTSKAYLYSNSIEYDIAVLKVENIKAKALLFGDSNKLDVTNSVLAAGFAYNFAGEASISKGIISSKRDFNEINYLQSDVSIDTGSSGGPLFTPKAEVVGMNTYVTENRTFTLSLSSETLNMILSVLLEKPTIEYLTEERQSTNINKVLVEVKYTDNENLELYNDKIIIERSAKKHKNELNNLQKEENVTISQGENSIKEYNHYHNNIFSH